MNAKGKVISGLVALFLAGLAVGGSVGYRVGKSKAPPPPPPRTERGDRERNDRGLREFTDHMCSRLEKDLDLTEAQVKHIRPILEQTAAEFKAIRKDNDGRVRAIFKARDERIKAFLNPEQIQKLEERNRARDLKVQKGSASRNKC